jgi:hypothetical protein
MCLFPYVLPHHSELRHGLISMARLNEWEREHLPCLKTASGRDLYFALVKRWLLRDEPNDAHMKTLVVRLTGRAMRIRIRNFEDMGLITSTQMVNDARARTLHPTAKMLATFELHSLAMRRIFGEYYFYAPK